MSLINCPECNQQRSTHARACPHCGFQNTPMTVTVSDLDIGFGNLVGLLVKLALAAIPALIILVAIAAIVAGILGGMK